MRTSFLILHDEFEEQRPCALRSFANKLLNILPMLTVARTLMGNPYLVLLDEPSEGVAPVIVEQMAHMILELKAHGVSILLSEQNMHFAELVSDRAYVLETGRVSAEGSAADLAADPAIRRSYLGGH